jgi:hypothetical protein
MSLESSTVSGHETLEAFKTGHMSVLLSLAVMALLHLICLIVLSRTSNEVSRASFLWRREISVSLVGITWDTITLELLFLSL